MARDDDAAEPGNADAPTAATKADSPRWVANTDPSPRRRPSEVRFPSRPKDQRFEPIGEIGRGGMGRVVEAQDNVLERRVAIKHALDDDADLLRRFEREAKITAQLEHPSIVTIHDAATDETGRPYYVMQRVQGEPLVDVVANAHHIKTRLGLVPNVLAAVDAAAYAHAHGVIHRDIKPPNILVGRFGETLLIDWGIACRIDDAETRTTAGTPGYMAPEQARGDALDPRADVYALGATLLHVLSGRTMLDTSATAWIERAQTGIAPPVELLPAEVPPELVAIVVKAMAIEPSERYENASAMAADLRAFLAGKLVAAHEYTAMERIIRFVRRHRIAIAVAAVALVVIVVGGVIAIRRVLSARDATTIARAKADSEERVAEDRAQMLLLDRASELARTDPTRSAALLRALSPASPHLPRARDIAAVAAANGIAHGRQAHVGVVTALEISPNGKLLASAAHDGTLRLHDLATQKMRTLVDGHEPIGLVVWVDDATITYTVKRKLLAVDVTTGSVRTLEADLEIYNQWTAEEPGRIRYHVPADAAVYERAVTGGERVTVATDARLVWGWSSQLLVAGKALRYLDGKTERVLAKDAANLIDIAVSPNAKRVAAVAAPGYVLIEWDLATGVERARWSNSGMRAVYAGPYLMTTNVRRGNTLDQMWPSGTVVEGVRGDWLALWRTRTMNAHALVSMKGTLAIIEDDGSTHLFEHEVEGARVIAGRWDSPIVAIGSNTGWVRWFDLRTMLPRKINVDSSAKNCLVDRQAVYIVQLMESIQVLPRDGSPAKAFPAVGSICLARVGKWFIYSDGEKFRVLDLETGTSSAPKAERYLFNDNELFYLDDTHVLRMDGQIVYTARRKILAATARRNVFAYLLDDHMLVRVRGSETDQIAVPTTTTFIDIGADDRIWLAAGTDLLRYDGKRIETVTTFGNKLERIDDIAGRGVAVRMGRSLWFVSNAGVVTRRVDAAAEITYTGARIVVARGREVSRMFIDTGERITRPMTTETSVWMVADDAVVQIRLNRFDLYEDQGPKTPEQLFEWIDRATNAVVDPVRDDLHWR